MSKQEIVVVWYKRDLRFTDHEPLYYAQKTNLPILLIYCFEPSIMQNHDSDVRHWRFVYQSLQDMQSKLIDQQTQIAIFHQEALYVFEELQKKYSLVSLFSYQEIGNHISFKRDLAIKEFCTHHQIKWKEYQHNGVIRKLKSRKNWEKRWKEKMEDAPKIIYENHGHFLTIDQSWYGNIKGKELPSSITQAHKSFQMGGETLSWKYLDSFLKERYTNYSKHISKPALSRRSCSRISPYLSYGNISMRMVYQYTMQHYKTASNKRALTNFISRLHWHCHFMQKFEDECRMEFEPVNKAFDTLIKPKNDAYILAWQKGKTGVPIVDACMRCVTETGYLNFRMRAMVVSFFVFNLWQDWRELHYLAKQFLDYEPGIHYPQLQMQSGITGINTIRIYNPIKNSMEHDEDAEFIKAWIPELGLVPTKLIHEPWKMSNLEQEMYQAIIGKDYPYPIVDIEESRKKASDIMWSFRKNKAVKDEGIRILQKHVNKKNNTQQDLFNNNTP
jgi:deoxyribodipyrimidine photo-lyase